MAGYSGTPLVKKLGIKEGHCLVLLDAPTDFGDLLGELPPDVAVHAELPVAACDVVVLFVVTRAELVRQFGRVAARLTPAGGLWVAWPKRASGVPTDLTEDVIRAVGLGEGLVDNKVCAIDDTWSGLRFVVRLRDRPRSAR